VPYAGIDAGSRTIKVLLVDADGRDVVASGIRDQGVDQEGLARELFTETLRSEGFSRRDVKRIVATGYGRDIVAFADTTVTEITCHARGVRFRAAEAMTIIDIGGQDTKVIRLADDGVVRDFAMNDRCAAGTGRFLEVVAARLGVKLEALGRMAAMARAPATINSTCVVFAESEIIGLLASGTAPQDIAAGVQNSLATRVSTLVRGNIEEPVIFTGGVALLPGMVYALETALGQSVAVAERPQFTGALGAALVAAGR